MINKILKLTKVSLIDLYSNNNILRNNKVILVVLLIAISYLSYTIIDYFQGIGQSISFLQIYILILFAISSFQTIIICNNVFFDSKDIEYLLPMPIKPSEIFVSKFNTIICGIYISELFYGIVPLILFGIINYMGIVYYFLAAFVLIVFPIFVCSLWTPIMLIIIKFLRPIGNKNIIQLLSIVIMMLMIVIGFTLGAVYTINNNQNLIIDKINNINSMLLIINPLIKVLISKSIYEVLLSIIKIILLTIFFFSVSLFIAKRTYYSSLIIKDKHNRTKILEINYADKIKQMSPAKAYIKKEIMSIIKTPIFLIQFIIMQVLYIVAAVALVKIIYPMIDYESSGINVSITFLGVILCIIQLLYGVSNIANTSFSREGSNAPILKIIPISFRMQFNLKKIPQLLVNAISAISIIVIFKVMNNSFGIIEMIMVLVISLLIDNLFSSLTLISDLKKPNLEWNSEALLLKSNQNQIYQYFLIIVFELLIMYIMNVCDELNYFIYLLINLIIFTVFNLILEYIVKNKISYWFKSIK